MTAAAPPLLEVRNLQVRFHLKRGLLTAVDDLSFSIQEKETFGIVGESGCGKSVTALSILRLVPVPPGEIGGEILFQGVNLLKQSGRSMQKIRGRAISMIFQEPMTALNPSMAIGEQIAESYVTHFGSSKKQAFAETEHILAQVRVPSPRAMLRRYPYELSGGMRQRVMIAMALSCQPKLLIADEPTTALDVTIQGQVLDLLEELQETMGMALLFISHNLGVVSRLCNRIGAMYGGSLVELADKQSLFTRPLHPYTRGLLDAIPRAERRAGLMPVIPGAVCNLFDPPRGCKFHPRCFKAQELCSHTAPTLQRRVDGTMAACHFPAA